MDMPFEDIKGRLSDWVRMESIQRQIRLRFRAFLERYKDDAGNEVYKQRINNMCIGMTQAHDTPSGDSDRLVDSHQLCRGFLQCYCIQVMIAGMLISASFAFSDKMQCCRQSPEPPARFEAICNSGDRHSFVAATSAQGCAGADA